MFQTSPGACRSLICRCHFPKTWVLVPETDLVWELGLAWPGSLCVLRIWADLRDDEPHASDWNYCSWANITFLLAPRLRESGFSFFSVRLCIDFQKLFLYHQNFSVSYYIFHIKQISSQRKEVPYISNLVVGIYVPPVTRPRSPSNNHIPSPSTLHSTTKKKYIQDGTGFLRTKGIRLDRLHTKGNSGAESQPILPRRFTARACQLHIFGIDRLLDSLCYQ